MAMKKDDDKTKKVASAKKKDSLGSPTMSGKKPYKIGGDNPLGVRKLNASKPTASISTGPRATPSRPMGKDATGERNWDKTPSSRATVSVGPATINMGGKTSKSTGGMDMSKGTVKPKKSVSPSAKMSPGNVITGNNVNNNSNPSWNKSNTAAAVIGGGFGVGAALSSKKVRGKIKQAAKYIGDTKERKARNRVQKAENEAMIVERKAKQEAKNPSTIVGKNSKISKSTMKKLKAK
jgi:hypothetical protein